jgi:peptide deformylase
MLKIVTVPNDVLTSSSKPVTSFDGKLHQLVKDMEDVLNAQVDPQGVGLAAPQVGIKLSLFIMKATAKSSVKAFINPVIKRPVLSKNEPSQKKTKKKKRHFEGCLSIPKIWSEIVRPKKILLEYQAVSGEKKNEWFSGFEAVIIDHEVDHLNGVLFTQRALEQKSQLYEEKKGKLVKMDY